MNQANLCETNTAVLGRSREIVTGMCLSFHNFVSPHANPFLSQGFKNFCEHIRVFSLNSALMFSFKTL